LALVDLVDRLTDPVSGGRKTQIAIGLALPVLMLCFAAYLYLALPVVITLPLPRKYGTSQQYLSTTSDHARYSLCLIVCTAALYFHFRWYWGLHSQLTDSAQFMTMMSLIAFGVAAFYACFAFFLTS
jgi:hypothetical protein